MSKKLLRKLSKRLRVWLGEELGISALSLPYQIEYGGAILKDSAVLAGLGVIGENNRALVEIRSLDALSGLKERAERASAEG